MWRHTLLVVHDRKEEENSKDTFAKVCGTVLIPCIVVPQTANVSKISIFLFFIRTIGQNSQCYRKSHPNFCKSVNEIFQHGATERYLQIVRNSSVDRISKCDQQTNWRVHLMHARSNIIFDEIRRSFLHCQLTCNERRHYELIKQYNLLTTPTVARASECPDIKNYKWPGWHRMLYSCTHMATVDIKGLNTCYLVSFFKSLFVLFMLLRNRRACKTAIFSKWKQHKNKHTRADLSLRSYLQNSTKFYNLDNVDVMLLM